MSGFQLKLAALLVVAIMAVVLFATSVTVILIRPPDPQNTIEPIARAIQLAVWIDQRDDGLPDFDSVGLAVSTDLPPEPPVNWPVAQLEAALAGTGIFVEGVFSKGGDDDAILAVRLESERWLLVDVPVIPDLNRALTIVILWAAMITLGAVTIALIAVGRITAPVKQIEAAIASVGKDGILPRIEPVGSASERETALVLNRLSERLQAAIASRMRLVAAAGHDLRTPLTRMLLRVEFLPEEERQAWRADLEELGQIADSAIRLVREEAGGDGENAPLELGVLLGDIAAELQQSGLKIAVADAAGGTVRAGRLALKRALRNLLVNAAVHGGGGRVSQAHEGNGIAVIIDDDGPGIPAHLLAQAFEPFFRVDAARNKVVPGAGLGLAIAREIIERFGGSIRLENRSPHGLRQVVWLPLA